MLYSLVWIFVAIQSVGLSALVYQVATDRRTIGRALRSRGYQLRWLSWTPFRHHLMRQVGDGWEQRPPAPGRAYRLTYTETGNTGARPRGASCMIGKDQTVYFAFEAKATPAVPTDATKYRRAA